MCVQCESSSSFTFRFHKEEKKLRPLVHDYCPVNLRNMNDNNRNDDNGVLILPPAKVYLYDPSLGSKKPRSLLHDIRPVDQRNTNNNS